LLRGREREKLAGSKGVKKGLSNNAALFRGECPLSLTKGAVSRGKKKKIMNPEST